MTALNLDKVRAQLRRPPDKRDIGGHGDEGGFVLLCMAFADPINDDDAALLFAAKVPVPKRNMDCSTCRFAEPMNYDSDPCASCVPHGPPFPKWRAK